MGNYGSVQTMAPSDQESAAPASADGMVQIVNKLGTFQFDRKLSLNFPTGVVGFPDIHEFGLADLPSANMEQFKLLQCITDPRVSFIVLPTAAEAAPIDPQDLIDACQTMNMNPADLVLLFIITIRSAGPGAGITMSINHRAPVLIDSVTRTGRQYVLSNNKYPVQHQIG